MKQVFFICITLEMLLIFLHDANISRGDQEVKFFRLGKVLHFTWSHAATHLLDISSENHQDEDRSHRFKTKSLIQTILAWKSVINKVRTYRQKILISST